MRFNTRSTGVALLIGVTALNGCGGGGGGSSSRSGAAAITSANTPLTPGNGATAAYARMNEPRAEHTATSTAAGVLAVGGETQGRVLASAELYQAGVWRAVGSLASPRKGHSATPLSSGLVLVTGGQADAVGQQVLNTSELFDPATNTFRAGPLMQQARTGHVAVAYRVGAAEFVLIAGGAGVAGTLATAELFDVSLGQFVPLAAPLGTDRIDARALLLPSGKILVQGGLSGVSPTTFSPTVAGAELFDPATRSFSPAGPLGIDRFAGGLSLLDGGRALVAGGASAARAEAGAETYDAASNTWQTVASSMVAAREGLSASPLPGGAVLLAGGADGQPVKTVEGFDAVAGAFARLGDLLEARRDHTATLLPSGRVLFVGGHGATGAVATSEEYDPSGAAPATLHVAVAPGQPIVPGSGGPIVPPVTGAAPQILAIYPAKGKPADLITIAGRNFAPRKSDNIVTFAGNVRGRVLFEVRIKRLPFLGAVETLVVEVPQGAQTGDLTVSVAGQPSRGKRFTLDLQAGGPPSILYSLPRRGNVGSFVTIFGRNFANPASGNVVRFAGVQASLVGGITTQSIPFLGNVSVMLVRVPAGAVTGDLTVEANGRRSGAKPFEVPGTTPATSTPPATTPPTTGTPPATGAPPATTPPATPGLNTTFFAEDFEGATVRFGQSGNLWEAAVPSAGPGRAASGQWCAGTAVTSGSYSSNARGYLISREIDLTQAVQAELRFNQWFETDGVDAGRVLITTDNGATYFLVRPRGGYAQTAIFSPGEGFAGRSGAWLATTVDLASFVGQRILVVFDFKADAADQRGGWYVDDVEVRGN